MADTTNEPIGPNKAISVAVLDAFTISVATVVTWFNPCDFRNEEKSPP